jgi:hypothetical protein
VVVYIHKDPSQYLKQLDGARVHRAEQLELFEIDRALIAALVARLARRVSFTLSVTDRELYIAIGDETLTGVVRRLALP